MAAKPDDSTQVLAMKLEAITGKAAVVPVPRPRRRNGLT